MKEPSQENLPVEQWLWTRKTCATTGHIFGCHNRGVGVQVAHGEWRPVWLRNRLRHPGCPAAKSAQSTAVSSARHAGPPAVLLGSALIPFVPHPACGQVSGLDLQGLLPPALSSSPCSVQALGPPTRQPQVSPSDILPSAPDAARSPLKLSRAGFSGLPAHEHHPGCLEMHAQHMDRIHPCDFGVPVA